MKQTTLFKISKIAKFVPELLLCLAQFHPSTMKLSTSISILPELAQLLPFADVARHVSSPHQSSPYHLRISTPIIMTILPVLDLNRPRASHYANWFVQNEMLLTGLVLWSMPTGYWSVQNEMLLTGLVCSKMRCCWSVQNEDGVKWSFQ